MKLRLALIIVLVAFCNAAAPEVTLLESNKDLRYALKMWCDDPLTATRTYGHISDWDLSLITDMSKLMRHCSTAESFNEDISRWNVANVTNMYGTFLGARAFNSDISSWKTVSNIAWNILRRQVIQSGYFLWNVKSWEFSFCILLCVRVQSRYRQLADWQGNEFASNLFGATKFKGHYFLEH